MPQIGPAEILVVLLVGLLVFGPKRLPEIGRQVGRAMREVRKFQDTVKGELDDVLHLHEDVEASAPAPQNPYDAVEVPAALPPATPATPELPSAPPHAASQAPSRFRAPGPPRPASRAPSRFRAPGPRPTT